jgi:hypothetical protein
VISTPSYDKKEEINFKKGEIYDQKGGSMIKGEISSFMLNNWYL